MRKRHRSKGGCNMLYTKQNNLLCSFSLLMGHFLNGKQSVNYSLSPPKRWDSSKNKIAYLFLKNHIFKKQKLQQSILRCTSGNIFFWGGNCYAMQTIYHLLLQQKAFSQRYLLKTHAIPKQINKSKLK